LEVKTKSDVGNRLTRELLFKHIVGSEAPIAPDAEVLDAIGAGVPSV
jgi:hypothetical protein